MYIFYFKKAAINAFIFTTKSVAQVESNLFHLSECTAMSTCRISKNMVGKCSALVILDGGSFRCSAVIVYELK